VTWILRPFSLIVTRYMLPPRPTVAPPLCRLPSRCEIFFLSPRYDRMSNKSPSLFPHLLNIPTFSLFLKTFLCFYSPPSGFSLSTRLLFLCPALISVIPNFPGYRGQIQLGLTIFGFFLRRGSFSSWFFDGSATLFSPPPSRDIRSPPAPFSARGPF